MAIYQHHIMRVVFFTIFVVANSVIFAQELNFAQELKGAQVYHPNQGIYDYGKIDAKVIKNLEESGLVNDHGDIRDWLIVKAREYKENKVKRLDGGVADTPLGDISQQCYNDIMQFFGDYDSLTPYALKMWASWGEYTTWFKAIYTGNAKSPGQYELCASLNKKDDGLPFGAQYCMMVYPVVPTLLINAVIGTCMPASCSAAELKTAHEEFFRTTPGYGLLPPQNNIQYDCFESEDEPWTPGAIATLSILSFFGLLVLVGSFYHVSIHGYVTSVMENLKQASDESKNPENVYEQVVEDGEEKKEPLDEKSSEKSIGAGESDIRYPATDEKPTDIETKVSSNGSSKANGMTKLMIEEDQPKSNTTSVGNLARMDQLLMSFSVFYNTRKIFASPSSSSMLSCLNGIRVLSMWWVILGHAISFPLGLRYENPAYLFGVNAKTAFLPIGNGTLSVDSFFVLSGFLVTYLTLKELAKTNGKVNWFLFYFHRLWRITPLYMVCLGIWAGMSYHIGQGGGKDAFYDGSRRLCQDYWWTNILYINNLYPWPGSVNDKMCMGWSWYLANDMQFFVISPIIVYCLYRYWKYGVGLLIGLCAVSFGSTAYISWYWGLPLGYGGTLFYNNRTETTEGIDSTDDFVYAKPWCRIQAYIVGMALGYLLYKLKGKELKINKFLLLLGWLVSTFLACSSIYGSQVQATELTTPQWLAVTYNAIHRFAFSCSVAWVMFVCITGNGGYVNSFLGWNVWSPLAKLSFAAYMVHPIVIYLVILTKKSLLHFTYVELSYWFIANMVASYACAYILSVVIEGPTVGMEKALIGRLSASRDKKRKCDLPQQNQDKVARHSNKIQPN